MIFSVSELFATSSKVFWLIILSGMHFNFHWTGAVYVPLLATCLLPYGSLSGFLYHRSFFKGENAAGLYPCSAYFAATITLEVFFNAIYGSVFGTIAYYMINYQAFVKAEDPVLSSISFVAIMVVMTLVANVSDVVTATQECIWLDLPSCPPSCMPTGPSVVHHVGLTITRGRLCPVRRLYHHL